MIPELVLHFAKENASSVHVGLGEKAAQGSAICSELDLNLTWQARTTSLRFGLSKEPQMAMPSIKLAAEFPRNLLRGLSVPSMRMLCSGAM